MSGKEIPQTRAEYGRAGWWQRFWWGARPNALRRARRAEVDPDVEASIRNYAQITRTVSYALLFTVFLTVANSLALDRTLDLQTTWAAFALAMTQVGAFFALRRSNETRAYLGDVRLALHELTARSVLTSAVVYPRELEACRTAGDLRGRATDILRHLMDSRLFPRSVDAFSVWARDDRHGVWRIVAAVGASETTIHEFTQPILGEETDGAGVVANLAVTADRSASYYQATASTARNKWFKPDPAGSATETLAVFLLPDEQGVPIGAFSLTSGKANALDMEQDDLPERVKLIVDQCTATLVGVARRAHKLLNKGQ
jgi:hypothetical protein